MQHLLQNYQGFPQEYFVYCKGKWCTAGGKDPLFGRVDGFQIDPNTTGLR